MTHDVTRPRASGPSSVALQVNGEAVQVPAGATVADVVALVTGQQDPRGVAVAVDRCVVPRSEWATTRARADSLVEVVSAAAGG
jgi:sulfur carrier protein